jgi:hypothetical protein
MTRDRRCDGLFAAVEEAVAERAARTVWQSGA